MDFKIYRGDTLPDLKITLYSDQTPVPLTDAIQIRVIGARNRNIAFVKEGAGDEHGVVTATWDEADTASTGDIRIEVEVTWDGGRKQTFRPTDVVKVLPDFG